MALGSPIGILVAITDPTAAAATTTSRGTGGVGRLAWREHYRSTQPRGKKRTLLDELDEILANAQERIAPAEAVDTEAQDELRAAIDSALSLDITASLAQIQGQISALESLIREIDEEEVVLLVLH